MPSEIEPGWVPVRALLLDQQLPRSDARSFSAVVADAGTQTAYRALRSLDPAQVAASLPVLRVAGQLRELVARRSGRVASGARQDFGRAFLPIAEEPGTEFVVGMIGKFMTASQLEYRQFDPPDFAGFAEPGYGKVAVGFLVLPYGEKRSLLCTETRTVTTDPLSARQFRRYWRVVGPFAGYVMRHWLLLAKQRAEREQGGG